MWSRAVRSLSDCRRAEFDARSREEEINEGSLTFHVAALEGNAEEILRLFEARSRHGCWPLFSPDHISTLMSTKNSNGRTALHNASAFGRQAVVKVLLNNGAKMEARDNRGMQPYHLAAFGNHRYIFAMLKAEVDRRAHCEAREAFAMGHLERLGAGSRYLTHRKPHPPRTLQ